MPNLNVKDVGVAARKWVQRVGAAGQDYADGAGAAGNRWAAGAAASKANWQAGVTEAASKDRFSKGVQGAGPSSYTQGVQDKGVQRFAQGAAASEGKFTSRMGPVLNVIKSVNVPERGPRGAMGNYQRVSAIGQALRAHKLSK